MLFLDVFGCFWKQHETTTFVISCTLSQAAKDTVAILVMEFQHQYAPRLFLCETAVRQEILISEMQAAHLLKRK